ncbi:SUN domain-containing protein 1-like [Perca flavescens]|uniref:SUN domain-containing protein 1-like n=1 Tax=Perca flavescens TaxID=8167 RepID=UPI00106EBB2A|nr:SUN domain-containing protein 1-like [Perca flavescens]
MSRRSPRLEEAGYYTEEGTPIISYRETCYRIFQRRKRHRGHHHELIGHDGNTSNTGDTQNLNIETPAIETWTGVPTQANHTWTTAVQIISWLCILVLLAIGLTHYIQSMQLKQDQQEVEILRQQVIMMSMQLKEVRQEAEIVRQHAIMSVPPPLNFALESQGARILHHLSSDTYWPPGLKTIWDQIYKWLYSSKAQRRVIQGHVLLLPGQCWSFSGDQGHLLISLSHPVSITSVTLGHITKSQSPYGHIASAPRQFSIFGMRTTDKEGTHLGTLVYDEDGPAFQTFKLPNPDKGVFRYVKLQIDSNWGNIDYTCLYNFRVHGKIVEAEGKSTANT